MTIDLTGVPDPDPDAVELRELDRLMRKEFEPDWRERARLVPLLLEHARRSRELYRRLAGLHARETMGFDQALDHITARHGLAPDVTPDADADLAEIWELLDELTDGELTMIERARDCELLAALIGEHQDLPLSDAERRALHRRTLEHQRGQALALLATANREYETLRRQLTNRYGWPPTRQTLPHYQPLLDKLDVVRRLRERMDDLTRRIAETDAPEH